MDEFNNINNNIDGNDDEISRIQEDINNILNTTYSNNEKLSDFRDLDEETKSSLSQDNNNFLDKNYYTEIENIESEINVTPIFTENNFEGNNSKFYNETIKNKTSKNETKLFRRIIVLVCTICILSGCLIGYGLSVVIPKNSQKTENKIINDIESESAFAFDNTEKFDDSYNNTLENFDQKIISNHFVKLVNKVEPSVVCITTTLKNTYNSFNNMGDANSGSGIIFYEDKEKVYIVTNSHVVEKAASVQVSVQNSDIVPAMLVGADSEADLAVICISKDNLKNVGIENVVVAKFGDSDKMQVGEIVLAIGNALGEGNITTMGIVSAKEKQINIKNKPLTVLQTNAALNPGNSGGPLINMEGEVIGINTAKIAPISEFGVMSEAEGIGYSITSNKAKPIIEEFMNIMNKPFLGISGYNVDEEVSKMFDISDVGIYVARVIENTSAEKAGIKQGDVITSINGQKVLTMSELSEIIKSHNIGDIIEIEVIRNGKNTITVSATLEEFGSTNF